MTTEKAIQVAGMIAKGDVEPTLLESWMKFLETASAADAYRVLEAYNEALRSNPDLPQRVAPGFMKRLENLLPREDIRQNETPVRNIRWWIPATAAAVLIFVASYFISQRSHLPDDAVKDIVQQPATDVKPPAMNRAMIQLANGASVYLDSTTKGQLALEDNVKLVKLDDGKIAYEGTTTEAIYNTLYNPKGSRPVDMTLSDGSRVWLNAGSSVTYPVTFTGKERKVSINGEAYFEVAHDVQKPFVVTKGEMETWVLGTHFNINAYEDEPSIKVSLIEGSVEVYVGLHESEVMHAGQQAIIKDAIAIKNDVNMDEVMSWKNGLFKFNKTDIRSMLRQAERWYNIQVNYPNGIPDDKFTGEISRNVNLSEFVKILQYSDIRTDISENILIINP